MRNIGRFILLISIFLIPLSSSAQIFKCPKPNGSFAYQPTPCPDLSKQEVLKSSTGHTDDYATKKWAPSASAEGQASAPVHETGRAPISPGAATSEDPVAASAGVSSQETGKENSRLSSRQRLATILLGVAVMFATIVVVLWPLKFVATILDAGRRGYLTCFLSIFVCIFCASLFAVLGGALAKFQFLSIFATALLFIPLFKTNYLKGLILAGLVYAIFVVILPSLQQHPTPVGPQASISVGHTGSRDSLLSSGSAIRQHRVGL